MSNGGFVHVPHDDFASEPIPGIPAPLPEGEQLIWQGSPRWLSLAIRAFHIRKIAIYFAVIMLWRFVSSRSDGLSSLDAFSYAIGLVPVALAAIGILSLIAYGYARTSIYSITSKRVMIRSGVAMPITVNLPFTRINNVGLKQFRDGTGDLPLTLSNESRMAILAIWPHMRPWHITRPQPMMRALPDAAHVASVLAAALTGSAIPAASTPGAASESAPGQQQSAPSGFTPAH